MKSSAASISYASQAERKGQNMVKVQLVTQCPAKLLHPEPDIGEASRSEEGGLESC